MRPQNLNLRQTIEGMPLTFDGEAAKELTAVIQFNITGDESGDYQYNHAQYRCFADRLCFGLDIR